MENNVIIFSSVLTQEDIEDLASIGKDEIGVELVHVDNLMSGGDMLVSLIISIAAAGIYEYTIKLMIECLIHKTIKKKQNSISISYNNGTPVTIPVLPEDNDETISQKVNNAVEKLIHI